MPSDMSPYMRRFRFAPPSAEVPQVSQLSPVDSTSTGLSPSSPPPPQSTPTAPTSTPSVGPACDRCRSFKKKCSRTRPACQLCTKAGHPCRYSAAVVHTSASASIGAVPLAAADRQHPDRSKADWLSQIVHAAPTIPPKMDDPQSRATARRLVDAFFSNVYKAYPFLDRAQVLALLSARFHDFDDLQRRSGSGVASEDTILHQVMAIGYTTVRRVGHVADDDASVPAFAVNYAAVLQRCLLKGDGSGSSYKDSLQALQILVLLALYALFDPSGASPWMIVGVVARQAVLQGLTRKGFGDDGESEKTRELRHRLVGSIFVLDHMVAASLGLPVALTDEGMDVPLPGLTVEEFASPERATHAAFCRPAGTSSGCASWRTEYYEKCTSRETQPTVTPVS